MLYGVHTGISSLALLVSAVFWTALWGPAGLILSTPLTVCLVVIGRYAPQLAFLHILLATTRRWPPKLSSISGCWPWTRRKRERWWMSI